MLSQLFEHEIQKKEEENIKNTSEKKTWVGKSN